MPQIDFEKLLAESLAAHGRSPRTQETYTLMLRLFGRYLERAYTDKTFNTAGPEHVEAYQRADDDPGRAGQRPQGPLRDAVRDAARRAAELLEGLPAGALAVRGQDQGTALVPVDGGEGLQRRRRARRHRQGRVVSLLATPSPRTCSRAAPTSA